MPQPMIYLQQFLSAQIEMLPVQIGRPELASLED